MKKYFLILFVALFATIITNAQEEGGTTSGSFVNKNGYYILPEGGDIAIGIEMTPIFEYMGNMFNGTDGNYAPSASFRSGYFTNSLFLKYFLSDASALRVTFGFADATSYDKNYVRDDHAFQIDPLSNLKVEDMRTYMLKNYTLGIGYEMRRGSSRLQGLFGVQTYFFYGNTKQHFDYGNPMTEENPMPTTYNWGSNLYNNGRVVDYFNGEYYGFGLNAFVGFEYFILPKISIGSEFAYGFDIYKEKQEKLMYEYMDGTRLELEEALYPGSTDNILSGFNPSANFFVMFHF